MNLMNFLIISTNTFDTLLLNLNINLISTDSTYMITYLFANFFMYYIIFLMIRVIIYLLRMLFKKPSFLT